MSCYIKVHEVTQDMTICGGKIEDYKYRLKTLIESKQPEVHAKLDLQINGPRSAMVIWVSKDEVIAILKKRIAEETETFKELKKEYKKIMK